MKIVQVLLFVVTISALCIGIYISIDGSYKGVERDLVSITISIIVLWGIYLWQFKKQVNKQSGEKVD